MQDETPRGEPAVPLRRHIDINGEGRENFSFSHGEGSADGHKFRVVAWLSCDLDITFEEEENGERFRYFLSVHDFIQAAYEQFKKDKKITPP